MDVGVVGEEAFLRRVEEIGAVVDAGLFAGRATEDLRLPGVTVQGSEVGSANSKADDLQMAVEVDDAYGTVFTALMLDMMDESFGHPITG
jgi:hypothetical protein